MNFNFIAHDMLAPAMVRSVLKVQWSELSVENRYRQRTLALSISPLCSKCIRMTDYSEGRRMLPACGEKVWCNETAVVDILLGDAYHSHVVLFTMRR